MSNLLEQAIIDAAALRETALKSAEAALIDKYKDEFGSTFKKLLEQEDLGMTGGDAAPSMPPPEGNMQSPDMAGDVPMEEPGGEAFENVPSSFLDGDEDEMITIDFDKIEKQLQDVLSGPMLASPELDQQAGEQEAPEIEAGEMNEEIELDESQENDEEQEEIEEQEELDETLELDEGEGSGEEESEEQEELEEMYDAGGHFADYPGMDALSEMEDSEPELHIQILDDEEEQEESEEEFELDEIQDTSGLETQLGTAQKNVGSLQQQIAAAKARNEKETEANQPNPQDQITEQELQELDEEMYVDIDVEGLLSGYMGSTTRKKVQRDDLAKAKARDSREIARMELEREQLKDLENKLHESQSTNKKYSALVEDLKENLTTLKEHVEKLSISNAKLLYINKVFGNSSLNERQKQNIVESISRATTVLEAKTIYGTLQSAVQSVQDNRHKQSLSEALDRGSQAFISRPKTSSNVDDNFSERMKILAGISNKQ